MSYFSGSNCAVISDDVENVAQDVVQDVRHPSRIFTPFVILLLSSVGIAALMIFSVRPRFDAVGLISAAMLSVIFFIIFGNMTGDNIVGALPYATYPIPPHLGLDGISTTNLYQRPY